MKRLLTALLALGLATAVLVMPVSAYAWSPPPHHFHHGGGQFVPGFALGAITGLAVGSTFAPIYAAPAPVYAAPAAAYYYPGPVYAGPPPTCYPPQWAWNGYGWVLQPGFCR